MTFKQLSIGESFVFASENDPRFRCSGIERGPWIKLSARTYTKQTSPFDADTKDHAFWNHNHCQIGSINVEVNL